MKKILMIAPSSYPVTGAEAIVNIKLLKALSDSNQFNIDLVSRKWKWSHYPSDTLESFGVKLSSINIVEVDNVININTIKQIFMTYIKFGILSKGYHWAYPAWKIIKHLIKNNNYDYVVTKDVPSFVLGNCLKRKYGLKWVATWNDPCPPVMYPEPYGKGLGANLTIMQQRIIKKMKGADVHIFPNNRLCTYMNNYLKLNPEQCKIVPHVIIPHVSDEKRQYTDSLRLIHSGNLGNPRSPETFLKGLRLFLDFYPEAKISFAILGRCDSLVDDLISQLRLDNYVSYLAPVEYKESLRKLNSFDVAVIIEADCEEGIFLPTKVSDFMQTSTPIFAVSPQSGVLNDLYRDSSIPYYADVRDANAIYNQIKKIYNDFKNKTIRSNKEYVNEMTADYVVEMYKSI